MLSTLGEHFLEGRRVHTHIQTTTHCFIHSLFTAVSSHRAARPRLSLFLAVDLRVRLASQLAGLE
eukprot:6173713-Pleurochrysis_carterae.AAC.1